jgi:zinc protease
LFLESDRMRALAINQANLDNQRQIFLQQLASFENQLNLKTTPILMDIAYDNFAYKHSPLGSSNDVKAATLEELNDFYKSYYGPANAVLTLAGDFEIKDALNKIKKYFEAVAPRTPPKFPELIDPPQKSERRKTVEDELAQTPVVFIAYKVAPGNTADLYALSLLSDILSSGPSCRLYQSLVKDKEILTSASGGTLELRGSCLLMLNAVAKPGKDLAQVEKSIYEEISRIRDEPVTDAEIDRVRLQWRRARVQSLQGTLSRAILLGQYAADYGDPALINTAWNRIERVNAAEIQRVARIYLNESNRSVVIAFPKPTPARPPVAAADSRPQPAPSPQPLTTPRQRHARATLSARTGLRYQTQSLR